MKNQVYVCGTFYHLIVAILHNKAYREHGCKSLLIVTDFTSLLIGLIPLIEKSGFFNEVIPISFKTRVARRYKDAGFIRKNFFRTKTIIDSVEYYFNEPRYHDVIVNSEINLFFNLGTSSAYFVLRYPDVFIRMLEDGERNYFSRLGTLKILKRRYLYRSFVGEGHDAPVKEIHVQSPHRLIPRVRKKGIRFDYKTHMKNLSDDERKRLFGIFFNGEEATHIDSNGRKNILLITQPLSEDKYISEKDKLRMYERILDQYADGKKVFIKEHPRETTDYLLRLNRPVTIIPKSMPLELFDFLPGISFDSGITIYSSALNNCSCIKEKIFLGMDYDRRISVKERAL